MGVHYEALCNWIRQGEADRGERDDRLNATEKEELARLRRENRQLRGGLSLMCRPAGPGVPRGVAW
ncbi:transposase [Kitasatospora sp. NBC_01302]|uniref:transposase n=1 Tax=Kitasatospora sp. NBC_01302 TaxID=2903575 RepID=UPI003FA37ECE